MLHTLPIADSEQKIGSSFVRQFGEILKGSEDDGCLPRLMNKKALLHQGKGNKLISLMEILLSQIFQRKNRSEPKG